MKKSAYLIAALGLCMALPANAAVVTKTISFTTTDFIDIVGNQVPPVSTVSGSFTVTFDTAQNYLSDTADIIVNNFTGVTVASAFGFTYDSASHFFWFGGIQNQSNLVYTGTNDFVLTLDLSDISTARLVTCADPGIICGNRTGDAGVLASGYTTVASGSGFFEKAQSTTIGNGVPEPASWAMMLGGFAVLGGALRRRSPSVRFA